MEGQEGKEVRKPSFRERALAAAGELEAAEAERHEEALADRRRNQRQRLEGFLQRAGADLSIVTWSDDERLGCIAEIDGVRFAIREPQWLSDTREVVLEGDTCRHCRQNTVSAPVYDLAEVGLRLKGSEDGVFPHACTVPTPMAQAETQPGDRGAYPLSELGGYMTEGEIGIVKALRHLLVVEAQQAPH